MSSSFQRVFLLGAAVWLTGGGGVFAQGIKGRPIEFSEPPKEHSSTNVQSLMPGRSRLDQWESDMSSPFSPLPGRSLDGMIMPTPPQLPQPVIQNPKFLKDQERRREQMMFNPEEMYSLKSLEEPYAPPELTDDGRKVSDLRPMEQRYLELLNGNAARQTNQNQFPGSEYGSLTDGSLREPESTAPAYDSRSILRQSLRDIFNGGGSSLKDDQDSQELFGFGRGYTPPSKPSEYELLRKEAFRKIIDFGDTQPANAGANGLGNYTTPGWVDSSFYDPPKPVVTPPTVSQGTLPGSLNGSLPSSPSTYVSQPPPPEVRPSLAPSSPFMNIPRGNF